LKFQRFTPTGCGDIEMRKFEFGEKNQFLSSLFCQNPQMTLTENAQIKIINF